MADVKKVATRVSYGEALVELGNERDDFVVLDADLAAATQTGKFKAAHPERFYDAGIAESNLMGLAAGIATTGTSPLRAPLPCSPPVVRTSRCAIPSAIRTSTSKSAPRMRASRSVKTALRISAARTSRSCALFRV